MNAIKFYEDTYKHYEWDDCEVQSIDFIKENGLDYLVITIDSVLTYQHPDIRNRNSNQQNKSTPYKTECLKFQYHDDLIVWKNGKLKPLVRQNFIFDIEIASIELASEGRCIFHLIGDKSIISFCFSEYFIDEHSNI